MPRFESITSTTCERLREGTDSTGWPIGELLDVIGPGAWAPLLDGTTDQVARLDRPGKEGIPDSQRVTPGRARLNPRRREGAI